MNFLCSLITIKYFVFQFGRNAENNGNIFQKCHEPLITNLATESNICSRLACVCFSETVEHFAIFFSPDCELKKNTQERIDT